MGTFADAPPISHLFPSISLNKLSLPIKPPLCFQEEAVLLFIKCQRYWGSVACHDNGVRVCSQLALAQIGLEGVLARYNVSLPTVSKQSLGFPQPFPLHVLSWPLGLWIVGQVYCQKLRGLLAGTPRDCTLFERQLKHIHLDLP